MRSREGMTVMSNGFNENELKQKAMDYLKDHYNEDTLFG